ncbi:hypothetical protein Cfor_01984 [Coptotermes formosanus]|uniref:Uncharacterized protein n=1 Tax=Coptotermes formosanus TaxID=36987 RepID=A0A6L2Q4J8_COPFO|nr:hypothetical protein Cfor_01984 [Coptotermes formosanus]
MWQLINRKIGRTTEDDNKLELKLGNNLITNPKEMTEILNEYFTNITTNLTKPSIEHNNMLSQKINTCATSVFIYPVTEDEVVNMAKTLKNKHTAGPDDIPECLEYGVLSDTQHGFRKGKCLEVAVQEFIEKIQKTLDDGVHSVGIFIDLTKAYDTINRNILLQKLSSCGIRGITNLWFKSYLSNRRIMSFHNRQVKDPIRPQVTLNDITLDYVVDLKFLGIHITETLNWNIHLQTLAHTLSKIAFMIKSLNEILSPHMMRHINFTKFQATLRSGILFWGGIKGDSRIKIAKVQKRVIRILAGVSSRTSCRNLFKEFKILTIASLYILEVTCFICKYCNSLKKNTQVHQHDTRRKLDIHVKMKNTETYKKSVINMGTKIYNKLPGFLKEIDDTKIFRKKLKSFLLLHSFYSVEEFFAS